MNDSIQTPQRPSYAHFILALAGTAIVLAAMQAISTFVNLVLLALLITLLTLPIVRWLRGRGLSARASYLITLLLILLSVIVIFAIAAVSILSAVLNVESDMTNFESQWNTFATNAAQLGISLTALNAAMEQAARAVLDAVVLVVANSIQFIVFTAFLLLTTAFMLAEADSFSALLKSAVGENNPTFQRFSTSTSAVVTYLSITAIINLFIAIGDVILLWLLGVPNPLLWGVVSFVFGFIPYIGYWISFLPPFILAFSTGGPTTALLVLIGYALINGVVSQIVAPRLYGQGLNLSITLTLLAVLFWGSLLGPIGGILAVPLTAVLKSALLPSFEGAAWLATVLSNSRPRVRKQKHKGKSEGSTT